MTLPKRELPAAPPRDIILFHWSPSSNRDRINKLGLCPGMKSLQGDWRPPYVAFSDDPWLGWILSGHMWPEIKEWDLWSVNLAQQDSFDGSYEIITDTYRDTGRHYTKEYRIYQRIYKRDVTYLATRSQ